jgi:cytochrome c peroxidase
VQEENISRRDTPFAALAAGLFASAALAVTSSSHAAPPPPQAPPAANPSPVASALPAANPSPVASAQPAAKPSPAANAANAAPAANPQPASFPDAAGQWSNFSVSGSLDLASPFFRAQGTNGRSCATCHAPQDAWTSTPAQLQQRFAASKGADPVFASVDGTNCPSLDIATPAAHQSASSLLLSKGLIRVALAPPQNAQFAVTSVSNPYGCESKSTLSLYRRILPATNLAFLSTVMWDGRESPDGRSIYEDLLQQAANAIVTHEQAAAVPPNAVLDDIESLEVEQFTAQSVDAHAGALNVAGAEGGPLSLAQQSFTVGANNPFGASATTPGVPPTTVFTIYAAWERATGSDPVSLARASIGRGEHIFNTRPIAITGVAGINDQIGANGRPLGPITGTCGTCHNAPNAGSHTSALLVDIGLSQPALRTPDLPLITLVNLKTGATLQTSDPGYALTTGNWSDIGKFKVPTLRAVAARAPYFHNGSAATLDAVVDFYNQRFNLNLLPQEHADLVAFLSAL